MKQFLVLAVMVLISIGLAKADCGVIQGQDIQPIAIEPIGSVR